ncbi:MAG TPA: extracellular solute-binding protein [Candidatus Limiplasma sp.]|nr:extracellular solute-binding protein [Candidatus Limiplasma sp.]HRX08219.1 extracellular solute-binding protein [Candidatus Limiplasma sp.]
MKRALAMILTVLLLLAPLMGVSADEKKVVRVLLAGWDLNDGIDPVTAAPFKGFLTWWAENFTNEHPDIEVQINAIPWDTAQQKQQAELMAGNVDVLYTGSYVSQYYEMGLLRNIDDLLANDTEYNPLELFPEGIWNSAYNLVTSDGNRYALPAVMGQRYTVYDTTLFDQWGVEYLSEYPTTQEIIEKAKQMTGINPVTGEQNYGAWFYLPAPMDIFTFVAWSYAYDITGGIGTTEDPANIQWELNDEKMVQLFTDFGELVKCTPPGFLTGTGNEYYATEDNNVAIFLDQNGGNIMSQYYQTGETAMLDRYKASMNVGPNGEGWVAVDPIVMAANPQDVDAAWTVMKALASPARQEYHYSEFRWTPAVKDYSFLNPADIHTPYALKIADSAHYTLIDESNPFFTTEIVPLVNRYCSDVLSGKTVDIQAMLDELQAKAVAWSASQK